MVSTLLKSSLKYLLEPIPGRSPLMAIENRPASLSLFNFPNPFNAETVISYDLPYRTEVSLTLYNPAGQVVTRLVAGEQKGGRHRIVWNGRDENGEAVVSGIYLYHLKAGDMEHVQRLLLLK